MFSALLDQAMAAAHAGADPGVGLAAGDLMAEDVERERGLDEAEGILRGDGSLRDGGLIGVEAGVGNIVDAG